MDAISPKIWPGWMVATGLSLAKMPTSPSSRRYMRLGMNRNGRPRWFSVKICFPFANALGFPAKRKNSIAIEVLYELPAGLPTIICLSFETRVLGRRYGRRRRSVAKDNYAPDISAGVGRRGRERQFSTSGRLTRARGGILAPDCESPR